MISRFINTESTYYKETIQPVIKQSPALLSALQSFETGIFLFAHHWYPNSLLVTASAIEKALRAHYRYDANTFKDFKTLLDDLPHDYLSDSEIVSRKKLNDLRKMRNTFAHAGASPGDDAHAKKMLIDVAFEFFNYIWQRSFKIDLCACSQWFNSIRNCTYTYRKYRHIPEAIDLSTYHCFQEIRGGSKHWSLRPIELAFLIEEEEEGPTDIIFEIYKKRKKGLEKEIGGDFVWINCPFCSARMEKIMLVRYDHMFAVREKKVKFLECKCLDCGFYLSPQQILFFNSVADPQHYWDEIYQDTPEDFEWHWQKMREEQEQID